MTWLGLMPNWLRMLLMILAAMILLVMILGPLLLKARHRIRRDFRIVPAQDLDVPEEALDRIEADRADFEQAGFVWQGYYHFSAYTPGVESWFGLYRHPDYAGLAAMTATIWQAHRGMPGRMVLGYAELSGRFSGDFCLSVSNSRLMGAFEHESKLSLRYPGESVRGLIRTYQRVKGEHERAARYDIVAPGEEISFIIAQLRRELELQATEGLYRLDEARQEYRLTWPGTLVMVLRHLPPFSWLRSNAELRRARAWAARPEPPPLPPLE